MRTKVIMSITGGIGLAAGALTYLSFRFAPRPCSLRVPLLAAQPTCSAGSPTPPLTILPVTAAIPTIMNDHSAEGLHLKERPT